MRHQHGESYVMQSGQRFRQAFVVASQAAKAGHPGKTTLDHPTTRQQYKAMLGGWQSNNFKAQGRLLAVIGVAHFLNQNIHCNEDIQFERIEDAVTAFNDLEFPQFDNLDAFPAQAELCDSWPVETAPSRSRTR